MLLIAKKRHATRATVTERGTVFELSVLILSMVINTDTNGLLNEAHPFDTT